MDSIPVIQHWLVSVARAAGLEGAEALSISADTELGGAWDLVCMQTSLADVDLVARVASHYGLPIADLASAGTHGHRIVPAAMARKLTVLPLHYSDRHLIVATADPVSMEAERALGSIAGRSIRFEIASPSELRRAIETAYPTDTTPRHEIEPLTAEAAGGPLVLVVDDDGSMRTLLRAVLEKGGFRVREARDGESALELLGGPEAFSLVTLDLEMGELSGLEVLKRIRSRMATAAVPVVVATGADDPSIEMALFEAGADDFVVKPVDPPRFLLRIQAVLRRRASDSFLGL